MTASLQPRDHDPVGERERRIFLALDHLTVGEGLNHWIACVAGVHVHGNNAWVQVMRDGSDAGFVVRVPADASEADLQRTLAAVAL